MENPKKVITFKVARKCPELIAPAKPTPHELKLLSDIDDQEGLRFHVPAIQFYRRNPAAASTEGKADPVKIIRDAIAKALVFYYPFAGRLRERAARKLVVDCNGEGVLFVEANADVALQQLEDELYPPFPYLDKLLYDVPCSAGITNCPLLLIQVTRLTCGGFVFAIRLNHAMSDGTGLVQFMSAVGELARGAESPSVEPVWERHLLTARQPPRVSFRHREYDVVSEESNRTDKLAQRSFFFSASDVSALRRSLPPYLQSCSRFDIVAGCAWRSQTLALSPKSNEEIRFLCAMNIRNRMKPPLPAGYYGNGVAFPAAVTTPLELSKNPLEYAVELVRKAKEQATDEYVRSVADVMVVRGRPSFTAARTYLVSDLTHMGLEEVDFGWGRAAYGGAAKGVHNQINWYTASKNKMGEGGTMVPVCLPLNSMEVFVKQVQMMMTCTAPRTSPLRIISKCMSSKTRR